ncbi:MAG: hypothetical protein ACRDND_16520 [Streptosporangiaceae bacterium]
MAGMLQMRRSRGAFSGFLLMLLGLWGALIPFVGPYFHYAYTPDKAWTYNTGRLWLELLPGAAVFLGGFLLMVARGRHTALFGALLAAVAGAWFTLGTVLSPLWNHHVPMGGSPASNTVYMRIMEQLGFFTALGVVIVFVAAVALGRIASLASGIREVEKIPETTPPADTVPVETVRGETVRGETVRGETVRDEAVRDEAVRDETVRDEETRPVHTRLLPRRKIEDTTQTIG